MVQLYKRIIGSFITMLFACSLMMGLTALGGGIRPAYAEDVAPVAVVAPIGPNDTLRIDVVGQSELAHDYQVDGNGDITMLYVGKLHVGGLSPDAAGELVKDALGKIYVSPEVTLSRVTMGGLSVTLTGAIHNQGTSTVRRDSRLNDVVQLASPNADADLSKVQITRGQPGQAHTRINANLSDFLVNGTLSQNPGLADGDVIFVPSKSPVQFSVSVVGAITKPGRFDVQPGSTVYDVIRQGGGLMDSADHSGIYVQPFASLNRVAFDYDKAKQSPEDPSVNPVLKDGDKIVIPEVSNIPMISITGGVLKPGQYPIRTRLTLADAIGLAGGSESYAKLSDTTVTRESGDGAQVLKVNASKQEVAANFELQPGDNVIIPRGTPPTKTDPLSILGLGLSLLGLFRK